MAGVKKQAELAHSMLDNLSGKDTKKLSGFRIEVSMKAISLAEAVNAVRATPFFDPEYWLGMGDGPFSPIILTARLVSRDDLFANANWIHQKVIEDKLLVGDNNAKTTARQIKILTDVFNSFGWNRGLRNPSKSLDPGDWWNETAGSTPGSTDLVGQLNELCQTDSEVKLLFNSARFLAGTVPCRQHPDMVGHPYQVNNRSPFRVRCSAAGCNHKLGKAGLI
jgi:hypothetical protein